MFWDDFFFVWLVLFSCSADQLKIRQACFVKKYMDMQISQFSVEHVMDSQNGLVWKEL